MICVLGRQTHRTRSCFVTTPGSFLASHASTSDGSQRPTADA